MNSDGRTDFVVYDKENGKFYVALTDTNLIRNGVWHGWDWTIDYSTEWKDDLKLNPDLSNYSRPVLADFNTDGWNDIGIFCSDGNLRVDYGNGTAAALGHYEWAPNFMPAGLLAVAPGWAYLPTPTDYNGDGSVFITLKVPDGLPDQGRMYIIPPDGNAYRPEWDWMASSPHIFGGNDAVPLPGEFRRGYGSSVSVKEQSGEWRVLDKVDFSALIDIPPDLTGGDQSCHPVVGDFDNDLVDDRAVMCPDEWRIAYSGSAFGSLCDANGIRHIPLGYDKASFSFPGRSYPGGISYTYARQLIDLFMAMHPGVPPPIPVDMISVVSCSPGDC
jgi:hypothetical protein